MRHSIMFGSFVVCFISTLFNFTHAQEAGYYRWPSARAKTLVFGSEGDLWRLDNANRLPIRLTTHPEVESRPRVSYDGKWVAFDATYDGAQEVYVMPIGGGTPKQLTFEGGGASIRGWTHAGKVVFRSSSEPGPRMTFVLRTVDPETLEVESLPLLGASDYTENANGKTIFVTRFGLDTTSDNAKQYRGGRMAQLWRYHPEIDQEAERLAKDFNAPIRNPMWWNKRIYFISDKSGSDNIWSVDEQGNDVTQHTQFDGWQLNSPGLDQGQIVYQRGADLYRFKIADNTETKLAIKLITDREDSRIRWIDKPLRYLNSARIGGKAESVALTARGRVALAFTGTRRRVEFEIPAYARARSAVVGPNEEWVYLILDQDKYGEIWRFPANGLGPGEQLTENSDAHIWGLYPSPCGTKVVFDDSKGRLWSLELSSKIRGLLDPGLGNRDSPYGSVTWSHDGRYLAYDFVDERLIRRIVVRDMATGEHGIVTTGKFESYSPSFSPDMNWLYFISDRNFVASPASPWGDRNMGTTFDQRGKLYALQLSLDAKFPFERKNELTDQASTADDSESKETKTRNESDDEKSESSPEASKEQETPSIEFEGLAHRLWEIPAPPGDYMGLAAAEKFIYVVEREGRTVNLKSLAIDSARPSMKTFASNVRRFELSADSKILFVQSSDQGDPTFALVPVGAQAPSELRDHLARVGDWQLGIIPQEEWNQLLLDAWRLHRTFSYDANLRGVDWESVLEKYAPFVDRIGHRDELDDILGQMAAELGILHSQIVSGDEPRDEENGSIASLGAEYEVADQGVRITTIYEGEEDLPETWGPLRKPNVDIEVGDIITAINGRELKSIAELHRQLVNKAGQQVRIEFMREGAPRTEIVIPAMMRDASQFPYQHWLEATRRRVSTESEGKVGYLHIRGMGSSDIAAFARDFYHHFDKDAIIIDVRGNTGGNIDSWILATLMRKVWSFWESQLGGDWNRNMQQTFRGHLVVLINEGTYSDGETFAAGIKALELAPLIGTTTAGAGIWLSSRNTLADGGRARIAEFPQFSLDGRWLIEGRGVSPDIEVVNPPVSTFNGGDAQLDAALQYLKEKLESEPIPKLRANPLPALGTSGEDIKSP